MILLDALFVAGLLVAFLLGVAIGADLPRKDEPTLAEIDARLRRRYHD